MELQIRDVSKCYANGVQALKDVTLTIPAGMYGLLGPNGAGKSTLMRILATLQEPDEGSIRLGHLDVVNQKDEVRRTLGYLPQEFGVFPRVCAEELLDHFALLKGLAERRARKEVVEALLRQVNRSDAAIDSIHVATVPDVETGEVRFDRPAARVLADEELGHRIYALAQPLQPGDSLRLDFQVHVEPRGFRESGVDASVVADSAGVEVEVPMNEWVGIGVFAPAEAGAGELNQPLYVQKHRIRSGEQTITVTVPRSPVLAGIDPYHLLDWEERDDGNNIEGWRLRAEGAEPMHAHG